MCDGIKDFFTMPGLQYQSNRFKTLLKASSETNHILIQGPRGTGKSFFLQVFREQYPNHPDPIRLNCATIARGLADSELFGHKKGSFSGAVEDTLGFIKEDANNKQVLFLEEINSLPTEVQAKLLVFMETFEFYRVGGRKVKKAKIRIVATRNYEKGTEVRLDLLDRFSIVVEVPPLHKRRMDIFYFIGKKFPGLKLSNKDLLLLFSHNWPGNLRELERILDERRAGLSLAIEEHIEPGTLERALTSLIDAKFTPRQYNDTNRNYFGEILHSCDEDLLFTYYLYGKEATVSITSLNPPSDEYYCNININRFNETLESPLSTGHNDQNVPEVTEVSTITPTNGFSGEVIPCFFSLLYGRESICSDEPICTLDPYSKSSLQTIESAKKESSAISRKDLPFFTPLILRGIKDPSNLSFIAFLDACESACSENIKNSTSCKNITVDQVADFLIGEEGRFDAVFRDCFHKLGIGSQKKLSKLLDVPTTTLNRWCKKKKLT